MNDRLETRWRWHCHAQSVAVILAFALVGSAARSTEQQTVRAAESKSAATTQVVTIQNMQFDPAELVVKRGTRVVWINKDLFAHTATAKSFDSGNIEPDASWSYVASQPGDYAYLCAFHPTMKGRLVVR